MTRSPLALLLAAALAACAPAPRAQPPTGDPAVDVPRFDIRPGGAALSGDPIEISLVRFAPGAEVELTAERPVTVPWPPTSRQLYRARATFITDGQGALALATAAPRSGSYQGPDPRGLFWSMTPTGEAPATDWPDERIRLVARQAGRAPVETTLTLRKSDPAVAIRAADFPGAFLARLPGPERRPAIILLGGSEGSDYAARQLAPRLASQGYAVLGLPYYAPPWAARPDLAGLPPAFVDIPVERLEQARDWLLRQPDVDGERIALYGVSKGAEFALIAASKFTWVDAVVAIVPSDVVWEGWGAPGQAPGTRASFSWRGQALAFVPYDGMDAAIAALTGGKEARLRVPADRGRAAHPEAAARARIPVEEFRGALLVAGGMADQVWASGEMARNIAATRAAAGLATTALIDAEAGHALTGDGWSPTTQYDAGPLKVGGTPAANARAQAAVWRETLLFLAEALRPPPPR